MDDTIQIVLHPVIRSSLEAWLASKGLALAKILDATEEDLETYIIVSTRPLV